MQYVNHNKEKQQGRRRVCKKVQKTGVIFEGLSVKNWGDDNFENEARTVRYNFFEKIVREYNAKYLMTAHHGDDLIETILMRIVRGSTLKGYSGFSKCKLVEMGIQIIRPLISVTKDTLVKYCEENGVKYYIDKTNLDDCVHTRNRYRKCMLPFLKKKTH